VWASEPLFIFLKCGKGRGIASIFVGEGRVGEGGRVAFDNL